MKTSMVGFCPAVLSFGNPLMKALAARGKLAYMRCVGRLKPWDHAAGVLIHAETGGYSELADGEGAYRPAPPRATDGTLILAPDRAAWESLSAAFAAV
jgi:fructose-1,6-bisphosphatase/inositol monophosphatase family enzyme